MRAHIIIFCLLFSITGALTAQISKADRLFEEDNFYEAANLYQKIYKSSKSKESLEKLAIAYYNTLQFQKGKDITSRLVNGDFVEDDKSIEPRIYYLHAQFLSVFKEYQEAVTSLDKYRAATNQKMFDEKKALNQINSYQNNAPVYTIEPVGFNTDASEFSAFKLGNKIIFTSDRTGSTSSQTYNWTQRPFLDLWKIEVSSDGKAISDPEMFDTDLNTPLHQGSFVFSRDRKTIYFTQSETVNGKKIFGEGRKNKVKLYQSVQEEDGWSTPVLLSFCTEDANYEHPAMSPEGDYLYFASDKKGGYGNFDLYKVSLNKDGSFGSPENLGEQINTPEREQFPFVTMEGNLFFSSDGHLGLGMLDIFGAEKNEDGFGEVLNLGVPINSSYDDFSLSYTSKDKGFFSSNRAGRSDDIFTFESTRDLFRDQIETTIIVVDKHTQQLVPNVQLDIINSMGIIVDDSFISEPAQYTTVLEEGNYKINVAAPIYVPVLMEATITEETNEVSIGLEKSNEVVDVIRGQDDRAKDVIDRLLNDPNPPKIFAKEGKLYFDMPPIYFQFDRWYLTNNSKKTLDLLASKMVANPSLKVKINSHTDQRGSAAYNQVLSQKRAEETFKYLVNHGGVASNRLSYEGFGETNPAVSCGDECSYQEYSINRRSEFEIIAY